MKSPRSSLPRVLAFQFLLLLPTFAILDTNNNGLSDVWERKYNNGGLFANTILASDDEDKDGWDNAEEAVAGANPFDANPPDGIIVLSLNESSTPGLSSVTWNTFVGKNYQLFSSPDLANWQPVGENIADFDNTLSVDVNTTLPDNSIPSKMFWRVTVSDSDTDGDNLTNAEEYLLGTNYESVTSTLGILDYWLAENFIAILMDGGVSGIDLNGDSDGDGRNEHEEYLDGTDPNSQDGAMAAQWVIVKGDGPQHEVRSRTKQITIPKGRSMVMVVALASEEYPYYTMPDDMDQFDDRLTWNIQPVGQEAISGEINVNDLHLNWIISEVENLTLPGLPGPIHHATIKTISAPDTADLIIDVEISATNVADDRLPSYVALGFLPIDIIPDYNRDESINGMDKGRITRTNPYRFWVNDDNDWVEEHRSKNANDIPGSDDAASNTVIDGVRDLIDFFPLHIDLTNVLKHFPHSLYKYRLRHAEGAVKFHEVPETILIMIPSGNGPAAFLKDAPKAQSLDGATVSATGEGGTYLSDAILDACERGEGTLLCEITKETQQPLILEITKSNSPAIFAVEFPIKTSSVEKMYRHVNLRPAAGGAGGRATELGVPANYPDELPDLHSGKYFMLVHGYNVNGDQARGWHSESFKRLWWSGSKARFIGVSWYGEESQGGAGMTSPVASVIPAHLTPNYHANVINAFQTADDLAAVVNSLGGEVNIAAHSLGNMVVGLAIQDHGMNTENYYLLDAAVAMEAYDSGEAFQPNMTNGEWKYYDERLWATEWHKLSWPENDAHKKLTWRGRLGDVASKTNAYNFYSSEEEVLSNATATQSSTFTGAVTDDLAWDYVTKGNVIGEHTWALQELLKGKGISGEVLGSKYGGWKFNYKFLQWPMDEAPPSEISQYYAGLMENWLNPFNPYYFTRKLSPDEVTGLAGQDPQLKAKPFFSPPPVEHTHVDQLAMSFPARTNPAGRNSIGLFDDQGNDKYNFDMVSLKNGWFTSDQRKKRWLHSDIKDVAYLYTHQVWDEFKKIGKLHE